MQTEEQKREVTRFRVQRYREAHKSVTEIPEDVTPNVTLETVTLKGDVRPDVTLKVPSFDGKMKVYDPETDGVDGWHETDKGMRYILQDTGMGGMARRYSSGARMFSYR